MLTPLPSWNQPHVGAVAPPVASQVAPVLPPVWMMTCGSAQHPVSHRNITCRHAPLSDYFSQHLQTAHDP